MFFFKPIKYEWLAAGTPVLHPWGGAARTPFTRENSVLPRKIIDGIMRAMDRTIQLELHPTSEQGEALHETLQQFTDAYNFVCADAAFRRKRKMGCACITAPTTRPASRCPGLVSDLLIQTRVKATETLKSAFTRAREEGSSLS